MVDKGVKIDATKINAGRVIDTLTANSVTPLPEPYTTAEQRADIRLEEIPLINDDPEALAALKVLRDKGYSTDQVKEAYEGLQPVPVTKVRERQAKHSSLDMRVMTGTR